MLGKILPFSSGENHWYHIFSLNYYVLGIRIERKGDYLDLTYGYIKFKVDGKTTWYLTMEEGSVESDKIKGLCGNFNGDPDGENLSFCNLFITLAD